MTEPAGLAADRDGSGPEPADAADDGLNPLIHTMVRLRMCAALDRVEEAEFGWLLDVLGVSKSALSKHVSALVDAGYLHQRRATRDTRQRLWLGLTDTGRAACRAHVAALRRIVGDGPEAL